MSKAGDWMAQIKAAREAQQAAWDVAEREINALRNAPPSRLEHGAVKAVITADGWAKIAVGSGMINLDPFEALEVGQWLLDMFGEPS